MRITCEVLTFLPVFALSVPARLETKTGPPAGAGCSFPLGLRLLQHRRVAPPP